MTTDLPSSDLPSSDLPSPDSRAPRSPADDGLVDAAVDQARRWLAGAGTGREVAGAAHLARLLRAPGGLGFALGFVDGVVRPEDPAVAAKELHRIAAEAPEALPAHLRAAVRLGGAVGPALPQVVVPAARRALRHLVRHLVVDARDPALGRFLATHQGGGVELNLNLLGEAVLGRAEAGRRLDGVRRLLSRPEVSHASLKVSSVVGPHSQWGHDDAVAETVRLLDTLVREASQGEAPTTLMLDMEEFRDLDLTLDVFMHLLDQPQHHQVTAGIVLQAYLPDSTAALTRLQDWAQDRVARGGAPVRVRLVKGANLLMERVEAELHGWAPAPWAEKSQTDAQYKRLLHQSLDPASTPSLGVGVASHNLFDVAYAWLLARSRDVEQAMTIEMLRGMAPGEAEVVRASTGRLLLYVPLVHPDEFDVAVSYLVRRLDEGASPDNYLSRAPRLREDEDAFAHEEARFRRAAADADTPGVATRRVQVRRQEGQGDTAASAGSGRLAFANAPDTDAAVEPNRRWGAALLGRAVECAGPERLADAGEVQAVSADVRRAAREWAGLGATGRAAVLHRVGDEVERRRGELLGVMAQECGKTLEQGDPEVSETVDFARYYAGRAEALETVAGACPVPVGLTVVTPPWNFPVAIPAGETLSALATGSGVVLKPAPEAMRCGSLLAEIAWSAGVPREVLRCVDVDEEGAGQALVAGEEVDRVLLTGAWETAQLFRSWRSDLPLLAETSGKNAVVVTPSADVDLAVRDVVAAAFGHAGQKCSATSLVILVGSTARSARFRRQLVDAVRSLRVGSALDPASQMGPLIRPAEGALLAALTRLEPGEQWWVEPQRLDAEGLTWTPGVKAGVAPGSTTHLTEFFGPVLGVMVAADLDEALALQNATDYGLTAGLHSLDPDEVEHWAPHVEAGNLYVNRGTTGAVVRRQPFGGWKRSSVGPGWKAGGPHRLHGLVDWRDAPSPHGGPVPEHRAHVVRAAAATGADADEVAWLGRAVASDVAAWRVLSTPVDPSELRAESNVLRHLPAPTSLRFGPATTVVQALRAYAAALTAVAGTPQVSVDPAAGEQVHSALLRVGGHAVVEDDGSWSRSLAGGADQVRVVGTDRESLARVAAAHPEVTFFQQPVVEAGEVELLPFVREQSVSVTAHRYGTPAGWVRSLSWVADARSAR
ncbi:proline dehydrogenase family protein [Nocardioides jishulii]|uniref:L-glutamate gamma-semialdehyde dehydrogenase n=1 Tax=Nocardioides jishulii TaxID=2575440 RepID=A0A4U2YNF3_9ACTN|nr:bifunctional proline dehydrogenase/L-glutamate gamma-semialdehyde dehydrogenase [Nocardioides jishulii]QCX27406.1 aldehyde dehydrogenase family protein [Nocardioides jishulii]TKI62212.1 aldehyde dehydrogenase family protein [Nocardioides jishulii]